MSIPTHVKRQFASRGWVFDRGAWVHPESGRNVVLDKDGVFHTVTPCGGYSVHYTWASLTTHLRAIGIWPERRGRPRKPTPCPLP
jgi:hypothetical protein